MKQPKGTQPGLPDELKDYWMTEDEAAEILKKHRCTISRMIAEGVLQKHSERYGRKVLVSRASVQRYLDRFKPVFIDSPIRRNRR